MNLSISSYLKQKKHIHLIGIGGVSMNSLAELLLSQGACISGSDQTPSSHTAHLTSLGIPIVYQHEARNVEGADLIIRTAAVHDDNPEIQEAKRQGIPILERAEAWGALMLDYENVICVAGTHGKTTTTSMMSLVAMEATCDPTIMVGSVLPAIGGTLRIGAKQYFVAESCEYCNSFLNFHPTIAMLLNIEADHLDFFKDLDDILQSFRAFCLRLPPSGTVIANADDVNVMQATQGIERTVCTFGLTEQADVYPANIKCIHGYYQFDVMVRGAWYTHIALSVPGKHNMQNALAVCATSYVLGLAGDALARGLTSFIGSARRFQKMGTLPCGATIIDDYAHHPSEITATLSTAKQMDFDRIVCIFQPHTYTRTHALLQDFAKALSLCDQVYLAPIYAAREQNTLGISSHDLAMLIPNAIALDSFDALVQAVAAQAQPNDCVLTMGAGNIYEVGTMLLDATR